MGFESNLLTPHPEYLSLGANTQERMENYRAFLRRRIDEDLMKEIRNCVKAGLVLGSEHFKDEIETAFARKVRPGIAGRPRKTLA